MTSPSRSHSTLVAVGPLRNPPLTTVGAEPTVGEPLRVGWLAGSGASTSRVSATMRTGRSMLATFPALSSSVDLGLVVGEDEGAAGRARRGGGVELGGEADRAVLEVGPVDRLAVRDVELGRLLRRVRIDGRIASRPRVLVPVLAL